MEKYVLPQKNKTDFKFPASHLLLQQVRQVQLSQFSMSQPAGRTRGQNDRPC